MARLKVGDYAPRMVAQTLAGEAVELGEMWGNGRSLLLVFLRHLA